jgi:hypothetical protein
MDINLHINHCNASFIVGFVCVMIMVIVLCNSIKTALQIILNRETRKNLEDKKVSLEGSVKDGREE